MGRKAATVVLWAGFAASVALLPTCVDAQAPKRAVKAPTVRRAQDPDVIEAAGGNFAIALNVRWDGGSQEVTDLKGCTATIKSSKQTLGVLTIDEQIFDAGDLVGGDIESADNGTSYEMKFFSAPKLRQFVTRKRTLYIDGAVRTQPVEKVVYVSISVPSNPSADVTKTIIMALRSYRDFCARQ